MIINDSIKINEVKSIDLGNDSTAYQLGGLKEGLNESLKWSIPPVNGFGTTNRPDPYGKKYTIGSNEDDTIEFEVGYDQDEFDSPGYFVQAIMEDPDGQLYTIYSDKTYKTQDEAKRKAEEAARKYKNGMTAKEFMNANRSIFTDIMES